MISANRRRRAADTVDLSKHQRLHEILGLLGNSRISVETFLRLMAQHHLTDDDIDAFCKIEGRWTPPVDGEGQ